MCELFTFCYRSLGIVRPGDRVLARRLKIALGPPRTGPIEAIATWGGPGAVAAAAPGSTPAVGAVPRPTPAQRDAGRSLVRTVRALGCRSEPVSYATYSVGARRSGAAAQSAARPIGHDQAVPCPGCREYLCRANVAVKPVAAAARSPVCFPIDGGQKPPDVAKWAASR